MFEGISEVKMVADEGEMRYFAWMAARSASLNPGGRQLEMEVIERNI
jgi:hypothetical protein